MTDAWKYENVTLRGSVSSAACSFARVMSDYEGALFDVLYFMDRTEKWDPEYRAWLEHGRPTGADDDGWEGFTEAVEEMRRS